MKRRNPWFVAIFCLVTLFIYRIYWLYKTKEELIAKGAKIPTLLLPLLPIFLSLTFFILAGIFDPAVFDENSNSIGGASTIFVIFGFITILIFLPAAFYWHYKYSKGVELATNGQTTFGYCFWIGIIASLVNLEFIWAGIIQNRFNKQVH